MKKSKLYGSRLIEDNKLTITPELVTLESTDDVTNLTFDRGNILDAASIKLYLAATSDDLTTKYNTLNENVTTNSNDIITINTLLTTTAESINSINANITTINNSLVDYGIALEYVDNKLILKNKNSDTLSSIDLSTMTEDTYLDTVTFSNNKLIFTWNEGSSKKPITIDLSRLKDKDGNELSVGNILAKSKLLFLSKNDSDTAKGLITFMKGVRIGNYTSESGGIIDIDLITGLTYLEVDKLKVRMKAYFETLSIINELSIAGKWTISPGGSILCTRVNTTAELNYKCYFTNILDNVQIENKFAVNDLAISKDFNIKTVEYQSATNHYYWRKVLEVGEDYIVLSKTDCDTGSDAPNVGDVICQLGNTTDVDRLNALVLSSVDDLSPCVNLYSGINTYSLANKEYVSYGVNKTTNKAFMNVYGDMYFGDRPTSSNNYEGASYIKYDSTNKKVTIKGELDVTSTVGGTDINQYIRNNSMNDGDVNSLIANSTVISDMLNLIDGAIETYFYTGVPTLSNLPASGWVEVATETNKETYANHVGDLYYDKDTGKAYRFMKDGNTGIYSWVTITDVDITKALADSSEALQTANVKRRIFYGTPTPPYDKGDLWVEATYPVGATKTDAVNNEYYSEILYCNTAKTLGSSFAITDWKLSNNYTKTIGTVITDLDGYKYIKDALLNDTETSGGLILSSLIALRDSSNDILSGINGTLNPEAIGKGIATWWGGKMIDGLFTPDVTTTNVTDYATSLIRFDGSGYLANGNISWDTTGKVHADPLSFFVGPTNIGIISSLFSTIPTDATTYAQVTKIHPTKPFDNITADTINATTFIGDLQGNAATSTKLKTPRNILGIPFDGSTDCNGNASITGTLGVGGALTSAIIHSTTIDATTFIGALQGNAATATKLKTARTVWGQNFDGSGNVNGDIALPSDKKIYIKGAWDEGHVIRHYDNDGLDGFGVSVGFCVKSYIDDINPIFLIKRSGDNYLNVYGNVGINTITPQYKLDVNGTMRASDGARFDKGAIFLGQTTAPTGLGTYVLNYVSSTYGARVTAYDGTNYQKLSLGKLISGTNFQLELNTDGTSKFNGGLITNGLESSKGGIFFGQNSVMPTGLGTYVANYVSDTYGARILAYDGAAYKDLKLGAMPTSGIFGLSLNANGDTRVGYNIGTSNFISRVTGWNVNNSGAADFRNIYADELRVQAFTADISQALAGSDYLTKSVSKLSSNFVVPSAGVSVRIIVDDIEGMPATRCFANGDYIRFRAFDRSSGLTIANVWGTVVLDTSYGTNGFLNGTQAYTFTCKATLGAGLTVFKGSEVLDYGTSGSGMISRTTLDTQGSPYELIATWVNDPSMANNYTVHARLGNLGGIANCNSYGLYTDNGFFTGKIVIGDLTKTANFLSFDSVNGLQIKLGGTSVATTTDVSNSLATANTNAQGYATTAQTNAINTASGDATTKANAAYSNAVSYTNSQITATNNSITAAVNGIQIGGRNLLRNSRNWSNLNFWFNNGGGLDIDTAVTYAGLPTLRTGANGNGGGIKGMAYKVEENTYYTYSAILKCTEANTVNGDSPLHKCVSASTSTSHNEQKQTTNITNIPANTWTLVSVTFLVPTGSSWFTPFIYDYIGTINIAYLKLEKGTKATDWSPAPEDVDANIATAQSTAISTAATNAAALYVTQTAYSSQVNILKDSINAKVSQTDFNALNTRVGTAESNIAQNANSITTKVSQTTFDALGTRVSTAETAITQNTTDIGLKVSKDGVIGAINLTSEAATISASKINLVGAVTIEALDSSVTAAALGGATPSDVSTAIGTSAMDATNKVNTAIGLNKWILKKYSYPTTSGMIPTFALINNLIPDFTEEKDDALAFSASQDNNKYDNYIGIVTTYLYCNADYTYTASNIAHDDGGSIYVNGSLVYSNGNCSSSNSISLPFKKGWNRIDLLWAEKLGVDNFSISHLFSQDSNITKMAAYPNVDTINPYSIAYANATQSSAQAYAIDNCVQVGLSNAPDAIKNQVLAALHGNFTYINGSSIYTGTLNANQVTAGYISADRIAANSITANKLATNVLSVGNITGLGSLATQNSLAYDGSYITNKPTSLSAINTTEGTKLGGIAAGATVGATWGTNVTGIPTNLSSLTGTEGIKNTLITISANGTLNGAGGGQVTVSGIGACTPTQAQGYVTTSQDNLATNLGYTNYSDLVAKAASTDFGTLVVGGYLNTALIQAQAISTNMLAANAITADKIDVNNISASIANVISLDASRITTGTLSADRIAGNTITGDKIVANSITGDKLVMNTITALGNVTAGSFNIGSGKFIVDSGGNLTAVNANINGTLNGVSGTFNYLQGVGSKGKLLIDGTYGSMTIEDEDFRQQGTKNGRTLRYYANNIRCRGSFGASSLNMARVHDAYIDYYVNGDTNSFVRFELQSNGVGGYYIPLYPTSNTGRYRISSGNATLADVDGFPVDLLIFDNSAVYRYEMIAGSCGKKVTIVNAHDNGPYILLDIINGAGHMLSGGQVQTYINIREFTNPLISSSVHGAGWMLCGEYDNNWA